MENSPSSSIEKQIDHFLEHFKRSASKAIDTEWGSGSDINNGPSSSSPQRQQPLQRLLQRTKSRSSCLDVSELSGGFSEMLHSDRHSAFSSSSSHHYLFSLTQGYFYCPHSTQRPIQIYWFSVLIAALAIRSSLMSWPRLWFLRNSIRLFRCLELITKFYWL